MASRWIVKRGDKEGGPFTSPQLKSLADSGQLRRTDLVTKQGENRYVPAEKVKGLFIPKDNPSPKDAPAKPSVPVKSKASDDEALDFGVVEIIDDDDDPVVVLEESDEEFEVVAVIDDEDDQFDFVEPEPSRSGRSRRGSSSKRSRGDSPSRRAAAPTKPARPKKPVKKLDDEEDEDENGPWLNVFYGLTCVFGGIAMFIALANEDPNTLESRRNGALLAIVRLLYNIGGRWMVLGLAIALSGVFFWSAYNQFRKA